MIYQEFLRVRNALMWFLLVALAIALFTSIIGLATGSMNVTVGDVPKPGAKIEDNSWVELFGAAGFIAAIMSTILGSTLSQENEHLELAWTKPQSRTRYATSLMTIDAIGIIIAHVAVFALIIGHMVLFHTGQVRLVGRPDDALNVVRFALFPLAWFGLIVALSAGMRGRAGVVQGLIWPVALGLTGLSAAPLPEIWHRIGAVINFINPISYLSIGLQGAGLAVVMLTLIVVASWYAATFQWRRLQA
jgi:hypothetical protein